MFISLLEQLDPHEFSFEDYNFNSEDISDVSTNLATKFFVFSLDLLLMFLVMKIEIIFYILKLNFRHFCLFSNNFKDYQIFKII